MVTLPSWWDDVARTFGTYRIGYTVWLPILLAESGGNPRAWNRKPPDDSVGLFQLNRRGGQGSGYSVEWLMDPRNNAEIAARPIAKAYDRFPNDYARMAMDSGHPGPVARNDKRIVRILQLREAIAGARTPQDAWERGLEAVGKPAPDGPPGDGDGGWIDGGAIGRGIIDALIPAWLKRLDPQELLWGSVFTVGGSMLITAGLFGLAMQTKTGKEAIGGAVGLIPSVPTRAIGATLAASASAAPAVASTVQTAANTDQIAELASQGIAYAV